MDMWKGYYGKEPFDLRLAALRMVYRLPLIGAVTILGTLLTGGGYYARNALQGERTYEAVSSYRVEYAVDNVEDMMNVYVNEMSWNTYMQSGMFLDAVSGHLAQSGGEEISREELAGAIYAQVLSDIRLPSTTVTTDDPEKSVRIAQAVEAAMTQELAAQMSEIDYMTVIDSGDTAAEVRPVLRMRRVSMFGAILSFLSVLAILLLKETGDDCIWLPASIWRRYGIKVAGTIESRELAENIGYFFRREGQALDGSDRDAAVCAVQEGLDAEEVLRCLRERCPDSVDDEWFAVPSPMEDPSVARRLREARGILVAVRAGKHAGRAFERVLEYLGQQDCPVTAAILWDADEKLLRRYDFTRTGGRERKPRR
jgi:capsular polysaccharide biosynthesis protein